MTDVLIVGDTLRMPELRHEVPLGIPDAFLLRGGGRATHGRHQLDGGDAGRGPRSRAGRAADGGVRIGRAETERPPDPRVRRRARPTHRTRSRDRAGDGPRGFPVGIADALRAGGVQLVVDQGLFDDRRRRKNAHELAGIRRAQRAAEAGVATARELLLRATPSGDGLAVDGEPLTCELLKERVQSVFLANGALAQEMIVSHGTQTAVGHDTGSGPIARDDVVLLDLFPMDLESACYADITRTFALGASPTRSATGTPCAGRRSTSPPRRSVRA